MNIGKIATLELALMRLGDVHAALSNANEPDLARKAEDLCMWTKAIIDTERAKLKEAMRLSGSIA